MATTTPEGGCWIKTVSLLCRVQTTVHETRLSPRVWWHHGRHAYLRDVREDPRRHLLLSQDAQAVPLPGSPSGTVSAVLWLRTLHVALAPGSTRLRPEVGTLRRERPRPCRADAETLALQRARAVANAKSGRNRVC